MIKINKLHPLILGTVFFLFACSENGSPVDSDVFVPQIENTWVDINDGEHTLSLTTNDTGVEQGLFEGEEDHPQHGFSFLYGSFRNRNVEMIIKRPQGDIKYSGTFVKNDRMELVSNSGSLIIERQFQ